MTDATLTRLWTSVSLLTLYCAVNGIADVQRSAFLLPLILEVRDTRGQAAKAIFWFLLTILPYLTSLSLTRAYIRRNAGHSAWDAWPVMFNLGLLMNDPLARRYQRFWMALLLLVPLYASGFLLNEVFELLVQQRKHTEILAKGWIPHLTTFRLGHDYRVFSEEDRIPVSYYPGFQPVAFLLLLAAAVYQWLRTLLGLKQASARRTASSEP